MARKSNPKKSGKFTDARKFKTREELVESADMIGRKPMKSSKSRNGSAITRDKGNDPAFYNGNPTLLAGAFNINFSYPAGIPIYRGVNPADGKALKNYYNNPVLAAVHLVPTFGHNTEPNSALNIAAQELYTKVRSVNSGSRNYDANDLIINVLGMADVFSAINWATRIYGLMTTFSPMNRALPKLLVEANQVDYESILGRTAEFRYRLNLIIAKTASLVVPSVFSLFRRRADVYTKVFIESDSIRDQMYMFVPDGFMKFTLDPTGAGKLSYQTLTTSGNKLSMDQMFDYLNDLIDQYFRDEDSAIMSGDLLKAYQNDIFKMSYIPETVPVVFTTDPNVLNQIKNAQPLDYGIGVLPDGALDLSQDTSKAFLVSPYQFPIVGLYAGITSATVSDAAGSGSLKNYIVHDQLLLRLLNVVTNNPTIDDVVEATRLQLGYRVDPNNDTLVELFPGSEMCTRIIVHQPDQNALGSFVTRQFYTRLGCLMSAETTYDTWAIAGFTQLYNTLGDSSGFKYLPMLKFFRGVYGAPTELTGSFRVWKPFDARPFVQYQTDNYTFISADTLERMHEAVLFDQIHVKGIAEV